MSRLTAAKRTELEEELVELIADLAAARTAYRSSLSRGMKSYKIDTGEGSQSATSYDPEKLKTDIDLIKSQIATLKRVLTGGNMRRFTLNRKPTYGSVTDNEI